MRSKFLEADTEAEGSSESPPKVLIQVTFFVECGRKSKRRSIPAGFVWLADISPTKVRWFLWGIVPASPHRLLPSRRLAHTCRALSLAGSVAVLSHPVLPAALTQCIRHLCFTGPACTPAMDFGGHRAVSYMQKLSSAGARCLNVRDACKSVPITSTGSSHHDPPRTSPCGPS